jgi:hypothetical protein
VRWLSGGGMTDINSEPFVAALAVNGPGTITVSCLNGLVTDCCPDFSTGPNGISFDVQESIGVAGGIDPHTDALIGEFVSRERTLATGFSAVDGKDKVRVGLLPADLFFIGTGRTFPVTEAGTLFLGINDSNGQSKGGRVYRFGHVTPQTKGSYARPQSASLSCLGVQAV